VTYSAVDFDTCSATGLAVEQTGDILAVSHGSNNSVALYNKVTGASLGMLTDGSRLSNPGGVAFAPLASGAAAQDLWVTSGTSVLHYVNIGTDAAPNYQYSSAITGLAAPRALAINPVNNTTGEVVVADGGSSQQVKAFNYAGGSLWTYGQLGGYDPSTGPSPAVADNKLYLDNTAGSGGTLSLYADFTFLAFQPNGTSLWVGDDGDSRSLQLTDTGTSATYSGQISYIESFYATAVDPVVNSNGTLRVFADSLEYQFNPNVALQAGDPNASGGDGSWTLVNNWNSALPSNLIGSTPQDVETLSNGRTYALMSDGTTVKTQWNGGH
jgi:hypothetical protein